MRKAAFYFFMQVSGIGPSQLAVIATGAHLVQQPALSRCMSKCLVLIIRCAICNSRLLNDDKELTMLHVANTAEQGMLYPIV